MKSFLTDYRPHRVLITGGAGFIGANFVRFLLTTDQHVEIINLDLLTYAGSLDNLQGLPAPERYRFVHGDIGDRAVVERLLRDGAIDTIVHFAADSHVDRSITGPAPFIETNVVGTYTLLDAARCYWLEQRGLDRSSCRFHHISTDEVFGSLGQDEPRFTEQTRYAPNSPYSASKAASDHLVRAYFQTFGLPAVVTNCSNNYGPFQHREKFIPTIIMACLAQRAIPVYGDGSNIRDWLYVEDHCHAIDLVLRTGRVGESYNVGGANEWANIDLARHICHIMDELRPQHAPHARLITLVQDRPGHDWRYAIDIGKIQRQLGWQPRETFDSGIRKTIAWYCGPRG